MSYLQSNRLIHRGWRILSAVTLLVCILLLAAGCTITTSVDVSIQKYTVTGAAAFGPYNLPLDGVEVYFNGPSDRVITTDYRGKFTATNLAKGTYEVSVNTPFGVAEQTLYVASNTSVNLNVKYPTWFDAKYFYNISGLWDLYAGDNGLVTDDGLGTWRWPNNVGVPIYLNTNGLVQSTWADNTWAYIGEWPKIVDNRVTTTRHNGAVPSYVDRYIQVEWVLDGSLGDGTVGLTSVKAFDANGYLRRVLIQVTKAYGDILTSAVLGHELLHAVGAGHIDDSSSILYPYVTAGQRNQLTALEREYMGYTYWIGPYLKLPYPLSVAAAGTSPIQAQQLPGAKVITTVVRPGKPTETVNGIPEFLAKQERVQQLFGSTTGSTGEFLWDTMGK